MHYFWSKSHADTTAVFIQSGKLHVDVLSVARKLSVDKLA